MGHEAFSDSTVRRVEWLTLALGGIGTIWAATRWGWKGAAGLAIGTALSWINFRWIKGSVRTVTRAATAEPETQRGPSRVSTYLKFFLRFILLVGVVYVILTRTGLPAVPVLAGLFAAAAGVVVGLVYELLWFGLRPGAGAK
jgi:ATP synthase I chain